MKKSNLRREALIAAHCQALVRSAAPKVCTGPCMLSEQIDHGVQSWWQRNRQILRSNYPQAKVKLHERGV